MLMSLFSSQIVAKIRNYIGVLLILILIQTKIHAKQIKTNSTVFEINARIIDSGLGLWSDEQVVIRIFLVGL